MDLIGFGTAHESLTKAPIANILQPKTWWRIPLYTYMKINIDVFFHSCNIVNVKWKSKSCAYYFVLQII